MNDVRSHRPSHSAPNWSSPVLENGDRLTQPEFHRRYEAYPEDVKIELVGGIVSWPRQRGIPMGATVSSSAGS